MQLKTKQALHLIVAVVFFALSAFSAIEGAWFAAALAALFGVDSLVYRRRSRELHELKVENARLRQQLAAAHASLN